jgi:phosphatidylserine/phosphatidylglycerophosphate/cardiolipin synthase-like enzyme
LLLLLVAVLFIGDRLGLVDINWEEFLGRPGTQPRPPAVEPVTGAWYQLYFSTPHYPDERGSRVDTIQKGLIEAVNSAQKSLDIAVYEFDLKESGDAILAARDRGVQVRIVTDSDTLEEDESLIRLKKAGLPIVPDERGAIMHDKFVVVDGQAVWTGSWNFTSNDTFRNNNNAIYIRSEQLARNYSTEFLEMYDQHAFGPTSPANTPSPQLQIGDTLVETCFAAEDHCAAKLIQAINQAQQSIRFMAFSFTHDGIGQAVLERAKAGVDVKGVFETRGSETEASQYGFLRAQNLDVWQDGNPYTLHHKVFVIDGKTVVMGSFNFSANADESNDENMLILHNADIAGQYLAEFERVDQQAKNPPE